MFGKKFRVYVRRFHRWIGIVIGLQLTIWVFTGVYFAWLSIDKIRGNDNNLKPGLVYPHAGELFPIARLLLPANLKLKSVMLEPTLRGPQYLVSAVDDQVFYFDAQTGAKLDMLAVDELTMFVGQQKAGVQVDGATLLTSKIREFGGRYPVYQVSLHDSWQGRLYVDPWSGKVLATRNMFWVVYDFFWMLHIMDYKGREDFNNALIRALSILSAGIIISGYFLFAFGKPPRRTKVQAAAENF